MPLPPFAVFLEEQRTLVYRFLVGTVGAQAAEDCFQETFLSALRAYRRLRDDSNLRAWVLAIASRKAIDHHRGRARRAVPVEHVPEQAVNDEGPRDDSLWAAVRGLPPKQRAAVVCRFANDLAYAEIGTVLECSEEAARRNVFEGLRALRGRSSTLDAEVIR